MKNISGLFPKLTYDRRRELLTLPCHGKADAVLDTDTFNEIDDQFALAFAALSPDALNLKAVLAAPFHNNRSSGPADGMEKSYEEILNVLKLLDKPADDFVFHGSTSFLKDAGTPVESDAAHRIIELAREAKAQGRVLYILAIAAITNVASALLMAPDIIDSVVVVWLGGHAFHTVPNTEFNLHQDIPASQVMFESGVPLMLIGYAVTYMGFTYTRAVSNATGDLDILELFWTYCSPNVVLQSAPLFALLQHARPRSEGVQRLLANLTTCGFGIFMLHYFYIGPSVMLVQAVGVPLGGQIPLGAVVAFAVSWLTVEVLRRVLGRRLSLIALGAR